MMKMLERSIVVVVLGCFLVGSLHGRELVDGKLAESWDHAQEGHALSSGSRHLNQIVYPKNCAELCNPVVSPKLSPNLSPVSIVDAFLFSECFLSGPVPLCCEKLERSGAGFVRKCPCARTIACQLTPFDGAGVFKQCAFDLPICNVTTVAPAAPVAPVPPVTPVTQESP